MADAHQDALRRKLLRLKSESDRIKVQRQQLRWVPAIGLFASLLGALWHPLAIVAGWLGTVSLWATALYVSSVHETDNERQRREIVERLAASSSASQNPPG